MVHALEAADSDQRVTPRSERPKPKIIFVGSAMNFSERVLSVFRAEFQDYDFIRVSGIAEIMVTRKMHDDVQLTIFEASRMQSALENPQRFFDAVGSARIIFSLSNPQDAAKFLAARTDHCGFENVGFLPLNGQIDVWVSVMQLFLCGQCFVPQEVADALIDVPTDTKASRDVQSALTAREWEVLQLVAQGTQNKIIAADLDLSVHTVKLHIHNLLKKIGVTNRTCAANWFMQHKHGHAETSRSAHDER